MLEADDTAEGADVDEVARSLLAQDRQAIEKSLAKEPERLKAHWTLVAVCLQLHDHDAVLAELERMDALFELKWADFSTIDQYKEFASSPQHARWLACLAAKK
ncbi:MAG TPA: hypothetical protein VGR31_10180 [Planctomycetota bacterium]|nr:hypothetical protein [Planctomycetota bacterium]